MLEHWKNFFHPHEGNDHHPHAYRKASAVALAGVIGLVLVITAAQTGYIRSSDTFLSSVLPSVLVDLTNENRQSQGLPDLKANDTLTQAAQLKANHMAKEGYFAHDSPSGVTPWEWFDAVGYTYQKAGENLAIDFSDSDAVVDAWMDSRLHRENILEEDFTEIGIATAKGEYQGRETVFVVQMFGTPDKRELADRSGDDGGVETVQADENGDDESSTADTTTTTTTTTATQTTSTEDLVAQLQNEVNEIQQEVVQSQGQTVEGTQQEEQTTDTPGTTSDKQETKETSFRADRLAQKPETNSDNTQTSQPDDKQTTTTRAATTSSETTQTNQTTTTTQAHFKQDTFSTPTPAGQVRGLTGVSLLPADEASGFAHFLSQPQLVYQLAFVSIAGLVLLVLMTSIIVEAKHHHWKLAGYSMLALVVLLAIFYAGSQLLFTEPIIAGSQIIFASNF
jgi:uncharacterized protein YkwD